jgi:hypothetical protein
MASFAFASVPANLGLTEAVPPAPGSPVAAKAARLTGSLQFSVHNLDARFARVGKLSVRPVAPALVGWFGFKDAPSTSPGRYEIEFEKDATQTVTVLVAIPADTAAGNYTFTLRIAAENATDSDFSESPAVTFAVPEAKVVTVPPAKFPWWVVAAVVAFVVLAGGGAYWAFSGSGPVTPSDQVVVPKIDPANPTLVKYLGQLEPLELIADPTPQVSSTLPPDTVIASPDAGKLVAKGSSVKITVATAPDAPNPCPNPKLLLCRIIVRRINETVTRPAAPK